MNKILITGAQSFIGTNFIRYSKNRDIREISIYNITPDTIDFRNIDIVLHLAAIVHINRNIRKEDYYRINRDLVIEVARYAKSAGVKHFIFLSTVKVYGTFSQDVYPLNEESSCNPVDYYGKSKYEAEQELRTLSDSNFTVSIIRTPIVYGDDVKANMSKLIKLIKKFSVLPLAKIDNKRNYTYIENLTGFIDRIIDLKAPGTFIVMDDHAISTTNLVNLLSKSLGKKIILFRLPKIIIKLGTIFLPELFGRLYGSFELDNSITKKILDFKPPFSTDEGIRRMIESYKNQLIN
ncbi:MAG: NAD-dependent epimerase/dehydratase family protein [Bacteroidales bacterium]